MVYKWWFKIFTHRSVLLFFLLQLMLILINKTCYQQFQFVDFNVTFSYLFLIMFFFHLPRSIHARLSTVFIETYLNITYIISHLHSNSVAQRKWLYVICLSLFYRGSHMFYFIAQYLLSISIFARSSEGVAYNFKVDGFSWHQESF